MPISNNPYRVTGHTQITTKETSCLPSVWDYRWKYQGDNYYSSHVMSHVMVLFTLRKLILQTRMRSHPMGLDVWFLAHLSRRLTRWAYSIPMVRRPSVRRRPHFQTWISLKSVGQSWSNYMCSITGMGERLHQVLGQIGLKLWFPWQQKAPIDL